MGGMRAENAHRKAFYLPSPVRGCAQVEISASSHFLYRSGVFTKSKPVPPPQTEKTTDLSFVKSAGKLLKEQCLGTASFRPCRAGVFLLPSSREPNFPRTENSPRFVRFLAGLLTVPLSCQLGLC